MGFVSLVLDLSVNSKLAGSQGMYSWYSNSETDYDRLTVAQRGRALFVCYLGYNSLQYQCTKVLRKWSWSSELLVEHELRAKGI